MAEGLAVALADYHRAESRLNEARAASASAKTTIDTAWSAASKRIKQIHDALLLQLEAEKRATHEEAEAATSELHHKTSCELGTSLSEFLKASRAYTKARDALTKTLPVIEPTKELRSDVTRVYIDNVEQKVSA